MEIDPRLKALDGQKFGRWTVVRKVANPHGKGSAYWECRCSCGNLSNVAGYTLRAGMSASCGCQSRERRLAAATKHGAKGTRLYRVWKGMRARCNIPSASGYQYYGGRGISVCNEWRSFAAFRSWAADGYAEHLTIERIDVDGNYEPGNCCWITKAAQALNKQK